MSILEIGVHGGLVLKLAMRCSSASLLLALVWPQVIFMSNPIWVPWILMSSFLIHVVLSFWSLSPSRSPTAFLEPVPLATLLCLLCGWRATQLGAQGLITTLVQPNTPWYTTVLLLGCVVGCGGCRTTRHAPKR